MSYRRLDVLSEAAIKEMSKASRGGNVPSNRMDAMHLSEREQKGVHRLCDLLLKKQVTRALHQDDAEYTWYKLNEWMQVEIIELMGSCLDHTPWFRFPFIEIMKTYFRTLAKESSIVLNKYGFARAFASTAFVTDIVPGVVMSFLVGQMQLLAYPLLWALGDSYEGQEDASQYEGVVMGGELLEEIVVQCPEMETLGRLPVSGPTGGQGSLPLPFGVDSEYVGDSSAGAGLVDTNFRQVGMLEYFQTAVDNRIKEVKMVSPTVFVLATPPFKVLGIVLAKLSSALPAARVLEISNQKEVQVRVTAPDDERRAVAVDVFSCMPGVQVVLEYQYPKIGNETQKHNLALQVQTCQLLTVYRQCTRLQGVYVEQVYDFWN